MSFGDTANSPAGVIALGAVMLLLSTLAVIGRVAARSMRKVQLAWDDYTIFIAWLFTLAQVVGIWIGAVNGNVGGHSTIDPETGLPYLNATLATFFKVLFSAFLTSTVAIGITKVSVLLLYKRIFQGSASNRWFKITIWSFIAISIGWTVAFFFANLLQCLPISINWTGYGGDDEHCIKSNTMNDVQALLDTLIDFCILIIPIPCIWSLQMPTKQKIAVLGMFMLGGLTVAISAVKFAYFKTISNLLNAEAVDLIWYETPLIYWPLVESALGVIAACLPLLKPVFVDYIPISRLTSYISSFGGSKNSTKNSSRGNSGNKSQQSVDVEKGGAILKSREVYVN